MLVAIGIVIILKQIPHAIGDDLDFIGEFEFDQKDGKNTFSEILASFSTLKAGALFISAIGLIILFSWTKLGETFRFMNALPASLFVVLAGVAMNESFAIWAPGWYLGDSKDHMVIYLFLLRLARFGVA